MEQNEPLTPTQVVAARMHALRVKRGWSAAELARRMRAEGIPWQRIVVTKLETGRRASVSVAELAALGVVLNCPPVMLMTSDDDSAAYQVTPALTGTMFGVRAWIRGAGPVDPDADPRDYYAELPVDEFYTAAGQSSVQQRWLRRPGAGDEKRDQDG
jgi:transcriptional regulator with XRE-family HTH domain